jgi:hypothetical protein
MSWTRQKFKIATADPDRKATVSGWTAKGVGMHRVSDTRDGLGRHQWTLSHLNTGHRFLTVNAKSSNDAKRVASLVLKAVDWEGLKELEDFAEKDPEWLARLLGIKHTLGDDWLEFPVPAMNDPPTSS